MPPLDLDPVVPASYPHIRFRPPLATANLACFDPFSWQSIPDWAKVTCRLLCLWPPLTSGQRPNLPTLTFLQLLGNLVWWLFKFSRFVFWMPSCNILPVLPRSAFACLSAELHLIRVLRHAKRRTDTLAMIGSPILCLSSSRRSSGGLICHVPPIRASHQIARKYRP